MTNICSARDCDRPTQDMLCSGCLTELVTSLRLIASGGELRTRIHKRKYGKEEIELPPVVDLRPGLYEELETTLARQHKLGSTSVGKISSTSGKPILFHEAASETKWMLENTVTTWARDFAETYTHLTLTATTTPEAAAWMATFPALLAEHPAASELFDQITSAVHRAHQVIDRLSDRVYVGPCDGYGAEDVPGFEPCWSDLFTKPGLSWARCNVCSREYHVQSRRDWMLASLEDMLGSSTEVADICTALGVKVSSSTIRMWVKRKKLRPHSWVPAKGEDAKDRPVYRVGDVVAVAAGQEVVTYTA